MKSLTNYDLDSVKYKPRCVWPKFLIIHFTPLQHAKLLYPNFFAMNNFATVHDHPCKLRNSQNCKIGRGTQNSLFGCNLWKKAE